MMKYSLVVFVSLCQFGWMMAGCVAMMSWPARHISSAPQAMLAPLEAKLYASEAPGVLGETCKSQPSKAGGLRAIPKSELMGNY